MITLDAVGKTEKKARRTAKRWFRMNPNRWQVSIKLSKTEILLLRRFDSLELNRKETKRVEKRVLGRIPRKLKKISS
jgi:hypothetical protein